MTQPVIIEVPARIDWRRVTPSEQQLYKIGLIRFLRESGLTADEASAHYAIPHLEKMKDEVLARMMTAAAEQQATEVKTETIKEDEIPMKQEETMSAAKIKEMFAHQEHNILMKIAALFNENQGASAPQPEAKAGPESTFNERLEDVMPTPSKMDFVCFFMGTATIAATASTANGIRMLTDVVSNTISLAGHGLAWSVENGGAWAGEAMKPEAARKSN